MKKQKRDIFGELNEGFDALKDQRAGKFTLRTVKMEDKPAPRSRPMKSCRRGRNSMCPAACSRGMCGRVPALWKTGSKAGRSPTRRRPS